MRLWLDEMISPGVAVQLRRLGYEAVAVQEAGQEWARELSDADQLAAATRQGRALVTFNVRDFAMLSQQWAEAQREHAGIVLVQSATIRSDDAGALIRSLAALLGDYSAADTLHGAVVFLQRSSRATGS